MGVSGVVIMSLLQRLFMMSYGVFKLKEKMTLIQVILSFVVLVSIFLFTDDYKDTQITGIVLSCFAFSFYAVADIFQKKISEHVDWSRAFFKTILSIYDAYYCSDCFFNCVFS